MSDSKVSIYGSRSVAVRLPHAENDRSWVEVRFGLSFVHVWECFEDGSRLLILCFRPEAVTFVHAAQNMDDQTSIGLGGLTVTVPTPFSADLMKAIGEVG